MKKEVKLLIEALLVSFAFVLLMIFAFIVSGYYMTKTYVPDILSEYNDTEKLSSKVSFGGIQPFGWGDYLLSFLLVFLVYFIVRLGVWKFRTSRRKAKERDIRAYGSGES